jgi:hypothetical protein
MAGNAGLFSFRLVDCGEAGSCDDRATFAVRLRARWREIAQAPGSTLTRPAADLSR